MSKSLFVAGLDYSVTSDDLKNMFAPYGTVDSAKVITDRDSGRSKGFGFVDMSSQQEAEDAIKNLNDKEQQDGRKLVVNIKRDDGGRKSFGGGGNRSGGGGGYGGGGGGKRW